MYLWSIWYNVKLFKLRTLEKYSIYGIANLPWGLEKMYLIRHSCENGETLLEERGRSKMETVSVFYVNRNDGCKLTKETYFFRDLLNPFECR